MQEAFDFATYARQVRTVARSLMDSGRSVAELSGRMHLLAVATERDLIRFADSLQLAQRACRPGCGACCVLNVNVLFPEAVAITWFLQRRMTEEDIEKLRFRLDELLRKTRWLDDEERLFLREPCAFLDDRGSCMIHRVRPLLCRSISSTDSSSCRDEIAMAPLQGTPQVLMNLFQKQLFVTVYQEMGEALGELGLDQQPKRLAAAVKALLAEPELATSYVTGQKIPLH